MSKEKTQFDLIVIGGGPGGYGAALYASAAGLEVALVENAKLGGTCLNVGCIPAKELLETASVLRTVRHAGEFGVQIGDPRLDLTKTMERKQAVIDQLISGVEGLLKNRKVTVYNGTGSFQSKTEVNVASVDGSKVLLSAQNIILASGSKPRTIPGFEIDGNQKCLLLVCPNYHQDLFSHPLKLKTDHGHPQPL